MTLWLDNMCLLRTLQFLKKKPNYECKLAGNLNHPLDNMFFCQNWIPSPQCVSGICFNKTNLSKAPKFEMKRIWEFLNHSRSTLLQDFLIPRIQGTKSHIGQWDQPAGGNVASHTLSDQQANRKGFGASPNHHFVRGKLLNFVGCNKKRSFRKLINLDKIWMNLISNLFLYLGSFG